MAPPANIPPIIGPARRSFTPVILFALVVLAALAARVSMDFKIPFPRCSFKAATGLPCAFCGGTRSLRAMAHLDFSGAFFWNPLVAGAAIVAFLCFLLWLIVPRPAFQRWSNSTQKLPALPISLTLIALNWIYLLLFLPR